MMSIQTLAYFVLWFLLNAGFNIYNRRVLDSLGLPWIVTFLQLGIGLLLVLPMWFCGLRQRPQLNLRLQDAMDSSKSSDWNWLLPIGVCHLLSSAGGVHAINSGDVTTFQVLKTLEPIVAAILAAVIYKQSFAWQVYATIMLIIGGVLYAFGENGYHRSEVSTTMVVGTFISMIGAAMRSLQSKQKMNKDMSPANVFAMMNATTVAMLAPFMLLEIGQVPAAWDRFSKSGQTGWAVLGDIFLSGFFFYTNNEVAFYALDQVHPISHAVGNIMRRVFIVAASVMFLNDVLTFQKATGGLVATVGVFLYSAAKHHYGKKRAD